MTRRDLSLLMPALLGAVAATVEADDKLPSGTYIHEKLVEKTNAQTGNKSRAIFSGTTHTDFPIEIHETDLAPGMMPHPAHHREHEEMVLLREGILEVTIGMTYNRIPLSSFAEIL